MNIPHEIRTQGTSAPLFNRSKPAPSYMENQLPTDGFIKSSVDEKPVSIQEIKGRISAADAEKTAETDFVSAVEESRQSASIFNMKYAEPENSVRIDIRRKTRVNEEGKTENIPYSPVGVDLGEGLFLDTSGNISFNPLRGDNDNFHQISVIHPHYGGTTNIYPDGDDAKIVYPHFGGTRTVSKEGNTTNIVHPGFQGNTTVKEEGNRTTVNHPGFAGTTTIIKNGNTTDIIHPGFAGKTVISEETSGARLIHPGFSGTTVIREEGNATGVIHPGFAGTTIVRKEGNTTKIIHPGFEGTTLVNKVGENIQIIHPHYGGMTEIKRN